MKKILPILIVSLLSLVFLSGCGYTKPLVAADEYEINKDLLGIWLPPKEEGEEQEANDLNQDFINEAERVGIYQFSNTEYLIILSPYPELAFRGYEIEFKEKKYLQLEMLFPNEVKEEEEEKKMTEEASEPFGSDTENDTEEGDNRTSGNESKSDAQKEVENLFFTDLCIGVMIEGECIGYDEKQQRFQIVQYKLSGNNLILKVANIKDMDSPANDINREGEDVFGEEEGYFERCSYLTIFKTLAYCP